MEVDGRERWAKTTMALAAIVVATSVVATLAWAALTSKARLLDGVEGEVLFEAARLREGLRLYVDPAEGAYEYGAVPARYLVLYPPLWSKALSLLPAAYAALFARALSTAAYLGLLGFVVAWAPKPRRLATALFAGLVAGTFVLALYATSARPDGLAVVLAGLALHRAAHRASAAAPAADPVVRIDAVAGALFALAVWLKPNVIGAVPGAVLGAMLATIARGARVGAALRGVLPALGAMAAVSAVVAGVLTIGTGKAWAIHLFASTGQPPSLALWQSQLLSRAPFFAFPLLGALYVGLRPPRDPGATVAGFALLTSIVWCVACLAKIGSASNYFLEPCVAATIVMARADVPDLRAPGRSGAAGRLAFALAAFLQAAWNGTASVKSAIEHVRAAPVRAATVASARASCGARPSDVILADEPGLELMMNGRIVATPFQSTHLARRGRFDVDAWIADVRRPEVACLVMQTDLLARPAADVRVEHDAFGPELRRTLADRFELVFERGGLFVYKVRATPEAKREHR